MPAPAICVVGSINLDMNSYVGRFPKTGETIHGLRFTTGYGGKGANQAVMAARLGGDVRFVGRVGDDLFGRDMLANLRSEHIASDGIGVTSGVSSGVAVITVNDQGENTIIVISGANGLLTAADVTKTSDVIASSRALICQFEVPLKATLAAMRIARQAGVLTIFNPAPATNELPDELFSLSDICCPNEMEAEILTGVPVKSEDGAAEAAQKLLKRGVPNVVITLGARGSLLVNVGGAHQVPAPLVKPVDTTGAGDAFVGSLAYFVAEGKALPSAIERANQIAAISVQSAGTQASFPHAAELSRVLFA